MDKRMVDQEFHNEDTDLELSLRPTQLKQYIGQSSIKSNLEVFIKAAKLRQEPLDHVLLFGPPGLGKTTLSNIIANEMEVNIRTISGPSLERPGDLAAILSGLQPGDVLFIDEIHRLSSVVEEVLYPAMEDFFLDIIIGKGDEARSIRIDLIDHKMMNCIINQYNGGPVGLDTIAVSIGEERVTIEDVYEPFLIQRGFLERTPRGRKATALAYEHFNTTNEKRE